MSATDLYTTLRNYIQGQPEVWFDDGDIVLEAQMVYFKVYSEILSQNSSFFKDMLSVPQPASPDREIYKGCTLLYMQDSPVDLGHFLKAIHDMRYYEPTAMTDFGLLRGVLRLSDKYDAGQLRRRAVQQLAVIFPTTLEAWDKRALNPTLPSFAARPFEVVNLARFTNTRSLLPAAMCSSAWIGSDLTGSSRVSSVQYIISGLKSYEGTHLELDPDDKRICLKAREALLVAVRTRLLGFLSTETGHTAGSQCASKKMKWLQWWEAAMYGGRAIHPFMLQFPWVEYKVDVCQNCYRQSQLAFERGRKALWNDLPGFFELPNWETLKRE